MLATLLLTLLVAAVLSTALLLSVGHRLRTASLARSVVAVVATAVVSGEIAARMSSCRPATSAWRSSPSSPLVSPSPAGAGRGTRWGSSSSPR